MITKQAYTHLVTVGTYVFKTILEKEKAIEAMENMQERAEDYDFHCDTEVMYQVLKPVYEFMDSCYIHEVISHLGAVLRDEGEFWPIFYYQCVSLYVFDNPAAEQYCNAIYEYLQSDGANVEEVMAIEKELDKDELYWVRRHV